MKNRIAGVILMLVSTIGGVYIGIWKCFLKAVIDIFNAIGARFMVLKICVVLFKILFGSWFTVSAAIFLFCYGLSIFKGHSSEH